MGRGAATKAAFGAVPAAPVPRFPASTTAPAIRTGAVSSGDGPGFVVLITLGQTDLRGRAPFSCGKKRALPLKLPLPLKTAHGKARSTRLPSFRAKNARRGSDNRTVARRGAAIPAPPAGYRRGYTPDHAVHPGDRQPSFIYSHRSRSMHRDNDFQRKKTWEKRLWSAGKSPSPARQPVLPFPSRQKTGPDKVFWRGGGARGGGRTFCPQKGGLPLAQIFSAPTAGDPARAGRWPRPHGRERWRPCPPDRRWYGPDAAPGYRRGRRGPGRARPAP